MRLFTYSATDAQGKVAQGTIQAGSSDEARLALIRGGWTVHEVNPAGPPNPPNIAPNAIPNRLNPTKPQNLASPTRIPTSTRPPAPQTAPTNRIAPSPSRIQTSSAPSTQIRLDAANVQTSVAGPAPVINKVAQTAPPVIHTRQGADKDRYFIFSQLAAAFRAGMNPVQTFGEVSQRSSAQFQPAMQALGETASEGGSLARTMARYPDLFPEHVVGLTEAGQQGGFLPDAFDQIANQALSAHKFKRWFFWTWIVAINAALLIPGMWWASRSLVKAWEIADANGGETSSGNPMTAALWQTLRWPIGPAFLLFLACSWAVYSFLSSRVAKRFRHRLGLQAPVYGKRALHENLSMFSWSLARLSNAGINPATSYRLATDTVPNLEMRDRLGGLAAQLSGAERMSQIIQGSRLFSDEYGPVIATAEYTGNLPGALHQLSDMSQSEFQVAETYAKFRSGCWGLLALFVAGGIGIIIFAHAWYVELPAKVLKGMDEIVWNRPF